MVKIRRGEDSSEEGADRKGHSVTALKQHWKPKRKPSTAKAFEEMINRTLIRTLEQSACRI